MTHNTRQRNQSLLRDFPKSKYPEIQKTLIAAAHASGKILMKHFRKRLLVREKPGAGIVTNADIASEKAAIQVLKKAFPNFGVLAEESREVYAQSPAQGFAHGFGRWIIDPLDGTSNFAQGHPNFCVSIAAEWNHEIIAGVIYHPVSGDTFTAVRNKGAFLNGKRIHVSGTRRLTQAFLSTGFSNQKEKHLSTEVKIFERLSRSSRAVRRPGSAALDLAYVAQGVFDGFWEVSLAPWDIAAGILLVKEAGGAVTDYHGESIRLDSESIVCTNGKIHQSLLKAACFQPNEGAAPSAEPFVERYAH